MNIASAIAYLACALLILHMTYRLLIPKKKEAGEDCDFIPESGQEGYTYPRCYRGSVGLDSDGKTYDCDTCIWHALKKEK
jgi:hypothetical protein